MKRPFAKFARGVILRQLLVGIAAFLVVGIFARRMLMIEDEVAAGVFAVGSALAGLSLVATAALSRAALGRHAPIVNALLTGDTDVEAHSLGQFGGLPTALTLRFFGASAAISAILLVPGIRPDMLDDGRAVSLFILATTILGGAAIPHYVLVRSATLGVIERAPDEPLTVLIEVLELHRTPYTRVVVRLLFAVVAPVALMGVGAVIITHTQLRTLVEQSGRATALVIARAALETSPGPEDQGQSDAAGSASEFGFLVRLVPQAAESSRPSFFREPGGQLVVVAPLSHGQAVVRFSADLDPTTMAGSVAVGLVGVLVAAVLGALFGRTLADDLLQATRRVRVLGTDSVLRGGTRIARPARFAVVSDLGRAIEELAQRFWVFAAAQERAIEARAAAQRMRSLLFASVSHDLKSPLNAILGFAELVGREDLTAAQRESLELIRNRGRELLVLIETILDAARVEAGQLNLSLRLTGISRLVAEVVFKARELAGNPEAQVALEVAENLPSITADAVHGPRALAVIVAHGIRTGMADPNAPPTHIRVTLPARPGDRVCFDVEFGSREVTHDELELLFARQATGRGRGLTLGLSLARSTIELHGGLVEVEGARDGRTICHVWLPLVAPSQRPRLSAFPTLG